MEQASVARCNLKFVGVVALFLLSAVFSTEALSIQRSPMNLTASVGASAELTCSVEGDRRMDVVWLRDGVDLGDVLSDHVSVREFTRFGSDGRERLQVVLKIHPVARTDAGAYRCRVEEGQRVLLSDEGFLRVEGLPSFTQDPASVSVLRGAAFNVTCAAEGPPDPVLITWFRNGAPLNHVEVSPSVLLVRGEETSAKYSCHASNARGVSVSHNALVNIKVVPTAPGSVSVPRAAAHSLNVSWVPGFEGFSTIASCVIQILRKGLTSDASITSRPTLTPHGFTSTASTTNPSTTNSSTTNSSTTTASTGPAPMPRGSASSTTANEQAWEVTAAPFPSWHVIEGLAAMATYQLRVACDNEVGRSDWSGWSQGNTTEGVPEVAPENVSLMQSGDWIDVTWAEVPPTLANGAVRGYRLIYSVHGAPPEALDAGRSARARLNVSATDGGNLTVQVLAYTAAGDGPASAELTVHLHQTAVGANLGAAERADWDWTPLVAGLLAVVAALALLALFLAAARRRKDTAFGRAFRTVPPSALEEPMVSYRAKKSYSRRAIDNTLTSLGVSEELKVKLKEVMLERRQLALGKVIGEGEFGSVIEGRLVREGASSEGTKVAVKTMKLDICSRNEMEEFLSEAVCMNEFDHPNVLGLIGVCMEMSQQHRMPRPMVVIPFMQHGDLHSFLLRSRISNQPTLVPLDTLVKFMVDIAGGMEYLASKNFIHRDLAARNCMLHENMTVCVADFGLSKKIYSGDYYRQGRIAKMPVKWIALESLADRLYTSKSDVWAFGVTMWEIATRGQMPYPGIANHEIYDYLQQGHRLKQPPDCLDQLYDLMYGCWHLDPTQRPSFTSLRYELEKIAKSLPEELYVNADQLDRGRAATEFFSELGACGGGGGGCTGGAGAVWCATDKDHGAGGDAAAAAVAAAFGDLDGCGDDGDDGGAAGCCRPVASCATVHCEGAGDCAEAESRYVVPPSAANNGPGEAQASERDPAATVPDKTV
uniref:receptor protein-tyrosine kinase n=1 Tax=Petromyzon marinus TaxID=7757 RepID=A0AAJ7X2C9_PETMA|nr:tyrosine-protein kinase receptor UFO isoform X1 [Petromyzon marinus]